MTDDASLPAVALLFADELLGAHLRAALTSLGARIVHEGPPAEVTREQLADSGANVVVVNLDDSDDDQVDHLYEVIDEDRQRVIFNDAAVSGALVGADRARWARHLAVKMLGHGDVDPPRPQDALTIESPVEPLPRDIADDDLHAEVAAEIAGDDSHAEVAVEIAGDDLHVEDAVEMAADDLHVEDAVEMATDDTVDSPPQDADLVDELMQVVSTPHMHVADAVDWEDPVDDTGFLTPEASTPERIELPEAADADQSDSLAYDGPADWLAASAHDDSGGDELTPANDHDVELTLADMMIEPTHQDHDPAASDERLHSAPEDAGFASATIIERQVQTSLPPVEEWDLVDFDAEQAAASQAVAPPAPMDQAASTATFETVSAADFLAPVAEANDPSVVPHSTLRLVSMEEALAPSMESADVVNEMILDGASAAIRHLVVLAAAPEGATGACDFVAALQSPLPALVVLVQHHKAADTAQVCVQLESVSDHPVRMIEDGMQGRKGEILVLPTGHRCQIARDGRVSMQAVGSTDDNNPSIDDCLISAASVFGADLLAIIFAGDTNDALAGAQAVYDRRGRVWAQDPKTCDVNGMVTMAIEDGVVTYVGSPVALATRLHEVLA